MLFTNAYRTIHHIASSLEFHPKVFRNGGIIAELHSSHNIQTYLPLSHSVASFHLNPTIILLKVPPELHPRPGVSCSL